MKRFLLTCSILGAIIISANAQLLYHQQFVSGHSLGSGASDGNIEVEETTCGELKVKDGSGTNAQAGIFMQLRDSLSTTGVTVDMSTATTVYVRARGKAGMEIGIRAREGSTNASATVEQALTTDWEWEVLTFNLAGNFTPADPSAISHLWIYFDKGTDGFLGDSAYIDYITIGAQPDDYANAYCKTDLEDPLSGPNLFHDNLDDDQDTLLSGSALDKVSMDESTDCGWMTLKEIDPSGDPVGAFGQLLVFFDNGEAIDVTGNAFVTIRAKVVASSDLDIRIDMRDSTNNNTSNGSSGRITKTWPANEWHTETYAFHPWNMIHTSGAELDITEIKAFNLYFETGTDEIDADSIIFDYVSVGGLGDLTETGCGVTAIQQDLSDQVKIYPSPATDKITIEMEQNAAFSVQIADISGNNHKEQSASGTTQIDISDLASGIYLVRISTNDGLIVKKLIVE